MKNNCSSQCNAFVEIVRFVKDKLEPASGRAYHNTKNNFHAGQNSAYKSLLRKMERKISETTSKNNPDEQMDECLTMTKASKNKPERMTLKPHEIRKIVDGFEKINSGLYYIIGAISRSNVEEEHQCDEKYRQTRLFKKVCQYREEFEQLKESLKPSIFL